MQDQLTNADYDGLRPLMFSVAYRMLGSVAEAEDIVQEAFLRMHRSDIVPDSLEAFATTITTRLAINHLRSARVRREQYVGPWLPEPLLTTSPEADPATLAEQADTLSMAFLRLLERLTPVERAVFILREVFAYEFAEIATVVDKSESNCRQILVRARQRVNDERPRFESSPERRDELAKQFFAASQDGDVQALEKLLADDVVLYGDGGGKAPAITTPLTGVTASARNIAGLFQRLSELDAVVEPVLVNGQPGGRVVTAAGDLIAVLELTISDGHITQIYGVNNPDKLRHLGPTYDWDAY